jgi:Carboxypeptidase regulatory-like domain/Prenyltransferase and squalene oxidase repeat
MDPQRSLIKSHRRSRLAIWGMTLFLLSALALLIPPANTLADDFSAVWLGDFGNVTAMEVTGNYDANNADGTINSAARALISKEFYRTHKDEYDFLMIVTNFDFKMPEAEARAFYMGVKNDTHGIGWELFDNTSFFGSGGRLQGTVDMGNLASIASDPYSPDFENTFYIVNHELMHRWGARVKFKAADGSTSSALLGKDGSHWSFLLDSQRSVLYGNTWQDNGDGTFTAKEGGKYFSPLDLYLMGIYDKSRVPPMMLIENPAVDAKQTPKPGTTISGIPRYVTIDDIIAVEGERIPPASQSQKKFNMAVIFITTPGTFTGDETNALENLLRGVATRYSILTDAAALLSATPAPIDEVAVNPWLFPEQGSKRTAAANVDEGAAWLVAAQKDDGSWGIDLRLTERETSEAVTVLKNFATGTPAAARGLQWLTANGNGNTDYLAARIAALADAGQNPSTLIAELLARQNADGGWGSDRNYSSNPVDTALALKALVAAHATGIAVDNGKTFLIARQSPDGGWGFQADAVSAVLVTAQVSATLQRLPSTSLLATVVRKATAFLLSRQNVDGGFGSSPSTVNETALAYRALSGEITDMTVLGLAAGYLSSAQWEDGSWQQDPYATALAVESLYSFARRPSPTPPPTTGTLTGTVADATTHQALAGASVTLVSDPAITALSTSGGSFTLAQVPQGSQSIVVSLSGYALVSRTVTLTAGSISDLGSFELVPNPATGIIKGTLTAEATGLPLAGVSVTVAGAFQGSVLTGTDGAFVIGNVTPGSVTITASMNGYQQVVTTGTVVTGQVLFFNPQLKIPIAVPVAGSVTGRVLDAATSQPLMRVIVALKSDPRITTTTDATGAFTLSAIPQGSQQLSFTQSGYAPSTAAVTVIAGSSVNLVAVTLSLTPVLSSVKGVLVDGATDQPLAGVVVTMTGVFSGTTVTGADGGFAVAGVAPGALSVTGAKIGYYPASMAGVVPAGGTLYLNARLTVIPPPPTTGTMTGKVVDAVSKLPLAGASVTLHGNNSIKATTDTSGSFTLAGIPSGNQQLEVSLAGYASATATVEMVAGVSLNLGSLPLSFNPTTGAIKGIITTAADGQPLSGVTVTVAGSFTGQAITGPDGSYLFPEVTPGSVTIAASKAGYYQAAGTGTIDAGGLQLFAPQLVLIPPQLTTGTITGRVVDATTKQALSGVSLILESDPALRTITDTSGSFLLGNIPTGSQVVQFALPGYAAATAKLTSTAGFSLDLGTLPLTSNPTTGVLKVTVTDAATGKAIEGATITVAGAGLTGISGSDGSFLFPELAGGELAVGVTKNGYYPMSGTVTLMPGWILSLDTQLLVIPAQPTTGTLIGQVVDAVGGQPLSGVTVTLAGDPPFAVTTDGAGGFSLPNVAPGSHTVDFSLVGYMTSRATLDMTAGVILNLGALPLASNATTGLIKGVVTDAAATLPLSGATVTVTGSFSGSTVTLADGSFVFSQATPGLVVITVTKAGYYPQTGTGTVTAGGMLLSNAVLREMPPAANTGEFTGVVVDAMTNLPIPGATISVAGESWVTTDAQGVFHASRITPGARYVIISAASHISLNYTVMIMEGVTTNIQTVYLTPLLQSSAVAGVVSDLLTGNPIEGAEVTVAGTSLSARTDSNGAYSISGITLLDFSLRASVTGYDSLLQSVSSAANGFYRVNFPLNPSKASALSIASLQTDNQSYPAYSAVSIQAEVLNSGPLAVAGTVSVTILDADGQVTDNLVATAADDNGVQNALIRFEPGVSKAITIQWETGNRLPGIYRAVLKVTEGETGMSFGTIVAAKGATLFTVAPTQAVASLTLTPLPRFVNYNATEQITVLASLVNRSNVPIELAVAYQWLSPSGGVLHSGTGTISVLPSEGSKSLQLETFPFTFTQSGVHPVQVTLQSGPLPAVVSGETVTVAPGTHIEPTQQLTPAKVTPDGDKRLRINIHLKGEVLK